MRELRALLVAIVASSASCAPLGSPPCVAPSGSAALELGPPGSGYCCVYPRGGPVVISVDVVETDATATSCAPCQALVGASMPGGAYTASIAGCAPVEDSGGARITCQVTYSCRPAGRAPASYERPRIDGEDRALGPYLAASAQLERAAVVAFEAIAATLSRFDAPPSLIARALDAAEDERRHEASMTALAQRHGSTPPRDDVDAPPHATLYSLGLENAREGCARELLGALVAHWQAAHADDPAIAEAMRTIADEETEHAALSLELHRWIANQVDAAERASLEAALADERARLRSAHELVSDERTRLALGLPTREVLCWLAASLFDRAS